MKKYELLYIVASPYTDKEIKQIQETVEKLLTKQGGEVSRNENLGKIKLAYPIKKEKYGTYVLVHFETETENIQQIERILGLTDEVLRHMVSALPEGAEDRKYELTGYVPPLSPTGEVQHDRDKKSEKSDKKSKSKSKSKPKKKATSKPASKPKKKKAKKSSETSKSSKKKEKKNKEEEDDDMQKLTMEELDEKLDEILDKDLSEKL